MVLAGNKAKCFLSVNHTTKTIHHQFIINTEQRTDDLYFLMEPCYS